MGELKRQHGDIWLDLGDQASDEGRDFVDAYERLHELGWAHSIEIYRPGTDELVGGLYGVAIGRVFFGESMFTRITNASKVALATLVEHLQRLDEEVLSTFEAVDFGPNGIDLDRHRLRGPLRDRQPMLGREWSFRP